MSKLDRMNEHDVVKAVRDLVQAAPNNRYRPPEYGLSCNYAKGACTDGSCGCLIGQALLKCGVTERKLKKFDDGDGMYAGRVLIDLKLINDERDPVHDWCTRVQQHQDQAYTWADAVAWADSFEDYTDHYVNT